MITFTTVIKRFAQQGEKTGWTYIDVKAVHAEQLMPGNKKSFRVKGSLDAFKFEGIALLPMGGGDFLLALNAALRKGIGKTKGAEVHAKIEVDHNPIVPPEELVDCLKDEPTAYQQFNKITKGHQNYFIKWIESAKTDPTKAKRIAACVSALAKGWDYGQMIRAMQSGNEGRI